MADWYVSPTGDDTTGDGGISNPFKHIYKAHSEAGTAGDTIYCIDGIYDEETGSLTNKEITIRSLSNDYSLVTIKPKIITGFGVAGFAGWARSYPAAVMRFYDLTLVYNHNDITTGNYSTYNGLIYNYDNASGSQSSCTRCFFLAEDVADGTLMYAGISGNTGICTPLIYKCTFRGWTNNDKSGGFWSYAASYRGLPTVIDCVFEGCSRGVGCRIESDVVQSENNNCFYNNTYNIRGASVDVALDATDITSDPLFSGADSAIIGDSSPCIDAGVVVPGYVDTYSGLAPDIGCYENEEVKGLLVYTGTYNEGSDSGSVDLGSSVISIGRISEVLLGGVNRPWCQQTEVILDDSDSYFIGTLAKGTDWYQGTFNIWALDSGSWTQLMTGYVPASGWTYDYSNKTVNLEVNSMIARAAAITMGFGGSLDDSQSTFDASSNFCALLGTITASSDGTVEMTQYQANAPQHPELNSYVWEVDDNGSLDTSNQGGARLLSFQGWTEGDSGTWTLDCQFSGGTADWMNVGVIAARTVPYPSGQSLNAGYNEGYPGIEMFFYQAGTHMGLTWDPDNWTKFKSDLEIIPLACEPMSGTNLYSTDFPSGNLPPASLGTAPLYYGGGLWVETMTDLMNSVGANWTVDGNGVIRAKVKRAAALEAVTGTVSFTDAEENLTASWTFRSTEGPTIVNVEQDWDNYNERLTGTAISEGLVNTGDVILHQAKWQRGFGGALLAERLMKWEQRVGRIFSLSYPVSFWGSFIPGSLVALSNIPGALDPDAASTGSSALLTAGKYVVQARHYDYMEQRIIAELRQVPPLTGVFILDVSELDGPDKLY